MSGNNIKQYQMVSTGRDLRRVLRRCKAEGETALDFETTSLSPADGRVRLVSLCNKKVRALVDFDKIKGGFPAVAHLFEDGSWVVFNAGFELRWFMSQEVYPECLDVGNLRRAILGGGNWSLKQIVLWDLDIDMDKGQQVSDWNREHLSQEQLDYAFYDAQVTWEEWVYWGLSADEGHYRGFRMLNDMVPAVIEMEDSGMLLDKVAHAALVEAWKREQTLRVKRIRRIVGEEDVANINSGDQWSDLFAAYMPAPYLANWPRTSKTGQLQQTNEVLKYFADLTYGTDLAKLLLALTEYKTISKYISSFGDSLITNASLSADGRIRARYNIGAAKTCRYSSSNPNLQQTPRDRDLLGTATSVRRSFVAGRGNRLLSYDYSGIELRTLALLSNDEQLLQDLIEGDVHAEVAAVIAGHAIDRTTKEGARARQGAKAVSFGIIYGAAAPGLSVTMHTTVGTAQGYIDFWEDRYPDAFRYRFARVDEVKKTKYIRMIDGGTIYMGSRADLPKAANYPVQRGALAIMARAIVRHKNTLDEERAAGRQIRTKFLATIHDQLIDESRTRDAARCLKLMGRDMTAAYLDVFPGAPTNKLLEGGVGPNWGDLK